MFELGLAKFALIALVALVVIGPAQLPHIARTVGALLGRAQRYLNEIKNEVNREIELEEWRNIKMEVEQSAHHIEQTIHDHLNEPDALHADIKPARRLPIPCKRSNWRAKRSSLPLWYKRMAVRNRAYVQSGAARMKRHRLTHQQRPVRFL